MINPYDSPFKPHVAIARRAVSAPATALMVISLIAIGFGALALAADVLLLISGSIDVLEASNEGPISKHTQVVVRTIWGIVLLSASSYVFYGSLKMKKMTDYGTARAAAIVAMIPLVGPCCLVGIPFGVWAFAVLSKPDIRNAFH